MNQPIQEPLPGLDPDPAPYPEPPLEEQDHEAAKGTGEEADGGTAAPVDSQP
jgi:hypothetical protein